MTTKAAHEQHHHGLSMISPHPVNATWNGSPTILQVEQNVNMPQTPNGTVIFSATNKAIQNNQGQLILTSGATLTPLDVPALANRPTILINNYRSNNLSVTNVSPNEATPIEVQAVGPGIPGMVPKVLQIGVPLVLNSGEVAQGNSAPQFMQLIFRSNAQTLGVMGFIGGPANSSGNNGHVITVNDPTPPPPPAGYHAVNSGNTYAFPSFNWGGGSVFVANLSPTIADPVTVILRAL